MSWSRCPAPCRSASQTRHETVRGVQYLPAPAQVLLTTWAAASFHDLVLASADGSARITLASGRLGFPWDARFASAGAVTFVHDWDADTLLGTLAAVARDGGAAQPIATGVAGYVPSTDGARLALFGAAPDGSLYVGAAQVGGAAPPWILTHAGEAAWTSDGRLLVTRSASPAPYRFQDGLYVADLR